MSTKQELFTKVTGLTYDVEKITDSKKLAWLIPDGAMLDNEEGRKAQLTKDFMDAAGIDDDKKFSTVEVEDNNSEDPVNTDTTDTDTVNTDTTDTDTTDTDTTDTDPTDTEGND